MAQPIEENSSISEKLSAVDKKRQLDDSEASEDPEKKKVKSDDGGKTTKMKPKRELTGPIVNNPEYYFENGLRKVRPYWFRFVTTVKGRWVGRQLGDVFREEMYAKDPTYFETQIKLGRVTVNDKPTTLDYVLKDNDIIKNVTHRHEMIILDKPIEIILNDENVVVVNKPCSIPVHQCGRYYFNTLTHLLHHEFGITDLRISHRLDRLTSGLVILSKTLSQSQVLFSDFKERRVRKEYVCRVAGEFPDGEIVCEQPIGSLCSKMGVHCVSATDGKPALTRFLKIWSDGKESIVSCKPETGRTHQIRIHLQYIGFPIVNDHMYNNTVFGPEKGKGGVFGMSMEQLIEDVGVEFGGASWIDDFDNRLAAFQEKRPEGSLDAPKPDPSSPFYDEFCADCHMASRDPKIDELEMYLHCLKYDGPDWSYATPMPKWAIAPEESSS